MVIELGTWNVLGKTYHGNRAGNMACAAASIGHLRLHTTIPTAQYSDSYMCM